MPYLNQTGKERHIINKPKKVLKKSEMTWFEPPPELYIGFWDQGAIEHAMADL